MPAYRHKFSAFFSLLAIQLRSLSTLSDPEPVDYPFATSDIAQLHRVDGGAAGAPLDQPTWDGLLLDPYFALLTDKVSIFGKQVLYRNLRDGVDATAREALGERLRLLQREPDQLARLVHACRSLRHADTDIAALLFEEPLPPIPKWSGLGWVLGAGLAASVAAVALTPLAWLGAGFFLYRLIAIQMRHHERIAAWDRSMNALQMLLRSGSLLGALNHPLLDGFARTLAPGVLAHTNGIALLAQRGFGADIEAKAAKVFDWLGAYLAQPDSGREVLRADAMLRRA